LLTNNLSVASNHRMINHNRRSSNRKSCEIKNRRSRSRSYPVRRILLLREVIHFVLAMGLGMGASRWVICGDDSGCAAKQGRAQHICIIVRGL
jgi:hypothetical protein